MLKTPRSFISSSFKESLWVVLKSKALKAKDLKRITIDTNVQEKAVQ